MRTTINNTHGQATVEYLLIGLILIGIIVAFGALAGQLNKGLFVEHAAASASHAITENTAGSIGDVFLY